MSSSILCPSFHKLAADTFDARIRIYAEANTRALTHVDPARAARRQKALAAVQSVVFRRAAEGKLKWISTQFPTQAYAIEAEMGWQEYQDFLFGANHCDDQTADPVAYWQEFGRWQQQVVERVTGHDRVTIQGPNADLSLSVRGRTFHELLRDSQPARWRDLHRAGGGFGQWLGGVSPIRACLPGARWRASA